MTLIIPNPLPLVSAECVLPSISCDTEEARFHQVTDRPPEQVPDRPCRDYICVLPSCFFDTRRPRGQARDFLLRTEKGENILHAAAKRGDKDMFDAVLAALHQECDDREQVGAGASSLGCLASRMQHECNSSSVSSGIPQEKTHTGSMNTKHRLDAGLYGRILA